jgi:acyl-CoA thioesterase-1
MVLPRTYRRFPVPLQACAVAAVLLAFSFSAACSGSAQTSGDGSPDAHAPAAAPLRTADARPAIVVLGDSLTAGLGLVEAQSYPALLQQKIDASGSQYRVINAGVSGDTSAGGLRRLDWALQDNVRVLVVALGANDGLRGLPVAEMQRNLAQIIETAQARHIAVILAGMEAPPNYGAEYAASFRKAFRDVAQKYDVPLIPFLLDRVAGEPALNQADGIHPNPQGAAIVADTVWTVLKPLLDRNTTS